jgi:hypothetical protein
MAEISKAGLLNLGGSIVKATQFGKYVALTTALGVFVTGCGGGPDNSGTSLTSRATTPAMPTYAPVAAAPSVSSGSGTIGFTANEQIGNLTASQQSLNDTLNKTLAAAQNAEKYSKKSANASSWILPTVLGIGGLLLAHNIYTGIKGKSFLGGLLGDQSRINKKNTDAAAEKTTKDVNGHTDLAASGVIQDVGGRVDDVGTEVHHVRKTGDMMFVTTSATAGHVQKIRKKVDKTDDTVTKLSDDEAARAQQGLEQRQQILDGQREINSSIKATNEKIQATIVTLEKSVQSTDKIVAEDKELIGNHLNFVKEKLIAMSKDTTDLSAKHNKTETDLAKLQKDFSDSAKLINEKMAEIAKKSDGMIRKDSFDGVIAEMQKQITVLTASTKTIAEAMEVQARTRAVAQLTGSEASKPAEAESSAGPEKAAKDLSGDAATGKTK